MTAIIYDKICSNKTNMSKLKDKWNVKLDIQMDIDQFLENFDKLYKLTTSVKIRNFQYRFLHRIIFTSNILYKWKIVDSPRCIFCLDEYETMEHLFFDCIKVQRLLEMFQAWFECLTDSEIVIDKESFFFCNHEDDLLNVLFILLKQYIFNRRCLDKELNVYTFKEHVMDIVRIERYAAFKTLKFKKFVKKWGRLFPASDQF